MKKRILSVLSALVLLAGLAVAAPAAANAYDARPTWRAYNASTWKIPAGWICGPTVNAKLLSAQACLISEGKYVQSAVVIRNRSAVQVPVNANAMLILEGNTVHFPCYPSSMAARGLSVCYGSSTDKWAGPFRAGGFVMGTPGGDFSVPASPSRR